MYGSRPPSSCLIFSYSCGVMPCSRIRSGVMGEFAVETMADIRSPIVDFRSISRQRSKYQTRNLSTGVRNTIFAFSAPFGQGLRVLVAGPGLPLF